ncbi:Hypothetical protein POVR1_LOCUS91 [uncultured virus]|nr:Hypothetical protein POVR1_LOCUS91 [uncultured virus]
MLHHPLQVTSLYGPVAFYYYRFPKRILLLSDLHYQGDHCKNDYHVVDWLRDLSTYQSLDLYLENAYWLNPTLQTNYLNSSALVDLLHSGLPFHSIDLRSIKYLQNDEPIDLRSFNHSDSLVVRLVSMVESNFPCQFDLENIDLMECVKYLMCANLNSTHYNRFFQRVYQYTLGKSISSDYLQEYMIWYRKIVVPKWRCLKDPHRFDEIFLELMKKRIDQRTVNHLLNCFEVYSLVQELGNIPIHYYGLIMIMISRNKNIVCYAGQNHIDFYRSFIATAGWPDPSLTIENKFDLDAEQADQCLRFPYPFNYFE